MALPESSNETDPLLPKSSPSPSDNVRALRTSPPAITGVSPQEGDSPHTDDDIKAKSPVKFLFSLLVDSIPVILSYTLQNSIQTISIVITGRIGPHELSVAAFSLMLAFVTGEFPTF
ncbi:hypothetical protein D9757_013876 [Collybiopsis confluens]|uniref:Uncharacterized protein n=1 Tax=Collybiopsis confluens TaxID=2823264 RepID=A0A8H5CP92_9AGAR|nr:hypothetical protein D9757_013876 [Collybiopsis confluens]